MTPNCLVKVYYIEDAVISGFLVFTIDVIVLYIITAIIIHKVLTIAITVMSFVIHTI
jgi:hypothetical protein